MEYSLPSDLSQVEATCRRILADINLPIDTMRAELAITEALNNAVLHGNGAVADKLVSVKTNETPDDVTLVISDEGRQLVQAMLELPAVDIDAPSGRGLALIQSLASRVRIIDGQLAITFVPFET
ncbi:MAG: ATP-binding protein [Pseudomonadales bacterium]|nr:ATP-binding protein [Pseudomonadales bacterium]